MRKRSAAALAVLALVLGGGFVALQLTGAVHAPAPPLDARAPQPARAPVPPPPRATPLSPHAAVAPRDLDSGTIDGRVINGVTRDGIPDAELTLVGVAGVSTFRTASDGGFTLVPPATGRFTLAAITAPGFLPYNPELDTSAAHVTLTRGHAIHGAVLVLYPAVDYAGLVIDARGGPVPGARVRLIRLPGDPELDNPAEWRTGADGRFTFQAADKAVLEARRGALRGWAHVDRSVVIMKKLTIRLGHPPPYDATITGLVRDVRGAPLAEALVRAIPSTYYTRAPPVFATTAANGTFTLAGVERAAYEVSAEAADHVRVVHPSVAGGSRNLALVLEDGLPLAGQVVDRHGDPVPAFTLIAQRRVGEARAPLATRSWIDPDGRFALRVAEGDYDLIVSAAEQARTAVHAAAGATDVRIVIGSGATLRGTVLSSEDGAPIAGAFVAPRTVERGPRLAMARPVTYTESDGTFELTGIAAGPLGLQVSAAGRDTKVEPLQVPDGAGSGPSAPITPITIELSRSAPREPRGADLAGIGANLIPDGDALRVLRVLPNSGALAAGIVAGDRIFAIEEVAVATLGLDGGIARIRGPAGTTVTLTLQRGGHDVTLAVERRPLPP